MEMVDVLKKLQEIAQKSPEVEKAIQSTEALNPTEAHGGEHSTSGRSMTSGEMDKREKIVKGMKKDKAGFKKRYGKDADAVMYATATKQAMADDEITELNVGSYKDFLKGKGVDIFKLSGDEHSKYSKMYKMAKDEAGKDAMMKRGTADQKTYTPSTKDTPAKIEDETNERVGGMSDIHIGAQEVVGEYTDEDGNLKMPKDQVIRAMEMEKAKAPFPKSYEIETAIKMVQDDFDDSGEPKADMEPAMDAEQPADEGNEFAMAVQKAKAAGMKSGDKFKVGDKEYTLKDSDFENINTNTMENKDKKEIKEAIQISTDSPQEAGMMMQILKLAGIQPMGADMPDMEPDMSKKMDVPGDDAMGSMQMAKMRDMMTAPDEEKQEETFANTPNEKTSDVDTLVNVHSGGLNKRKQQFKKEYPGDNPMAAEDKVTEEDLANSLRTQYESFKQAYQEAAKPDYIDLDKDGNKTEPMKKAAKDKEEKEKK